MFMKNVFIVIATLCLFSIPATVFACSCGPGDPPIEFNRAKAVFIGRMLGGTEKLSIKDQGAKPRFIEAGNVRFAVEEVFKGGVEDEVTIKIASNVGTSCGPYGLQRGERYVVYAYADQRDEKILYSGVCTRTVTTGSKYAKDDLDFLRNLPPPGVGGNIRGRIWADLRAGGATTPLPDVRVNIRTGDEQPITVFTDKEGQFEVTQLKAGKYKVEPEFPPNYTSERKYVEVKVDDRGTAGVGFEAYIDGRVSGRVVDKEGNTFNSIFLTMVGAGKTVSGHSNGEDGSFEVKGAPAGEYILYVEMKSTDYKKNKNYYYPGTFEREKAAVIRVGMEEKVDGLEFLLPDGFKVRTVEGEVLWKDGTPAANVEVMLVCPQSVGPDGFTVEFGPTRTRTNEQGQFRLEGFTAETYWIEARGRREVETKGDFVEAYTPLRKLFLRENVKNLKLVLSETGFVGGCPK
jgi:hypothetical protein